MPLTTAGISGRVISFREMMTLRLAQLKDENRDEGDRLAPEGSQSWREYVEITFKPH